MPNGTYERIKKNYDTLPLIEFSVFLILNNWFADYFLLRSRAMRLLSLEQLCTLLKHALAR